MPVFLLQSQFDSYLVTCTLRLKEGELQALPSTVPKPHNISRCVLLAACTVH